MDTSCITALLHYCIHIVATPVVRKTSSALQCVAVCCLEKCVYAYLLHEWEIQDWIRTTLLHYIHRKCSLEQTSFAVPKPPFGTPTKWCNTVSTAETPRCKWMSSTLRRQTNSLGGKKFFERLLFLRTYICACVLVIYIMCMHNVFRRTGCV